jgi:hypothetical protein
MGRKKGPEIPEEEKDLSRYYRLNTKAVDDLVNADVSNSPQVSRAELDRYRSGPKIRLRDWLKVLLVKWWFNGAVCFFFYWGLGNAVTNRENLLLILGVAIGFVADLLVNNIFRYYEKTPGGNGRWMMFGRKGFASLPLNVLYGFLLLLCVMMTYNTVNGVIVSVTGNRDSVPLGVEPILFGLITTGWDFLFLGIRRLGKQIVADAKQGNQTRKR